MALQVWLPLNNDLRNNGLSDLKFLNISTANTTSDTNGVFFKSYKNNSYKNGGLYSDKTISLGQNQSMFCWFKFTVLNSSSSLGGALVTQHRYQKNQGMGITIRYVSSTTGYLSVNTGNGSDRTYNEYYGTTLLQANTWYHGGYTYDGSTIRIYVNGMCEKTQSYPNMSVPADYINVFCWSLNGTSGPTPHNNYKLQGSLNDVRIYDNCLTPEDVNRIYNCKIMDIVATNYNNGFFYDNSGLLINKLVSTGLTFSGNSMYFNGLSTASGSQIRPKDGTSGLNISGGTLSVWFTPLSKPNKNILIYTDEKSHMSIGFLSTGKSIVVRCGTSNGNATTYATTGITWGSLNHIIVTYENTMPQSCFINGVSGVRYSSSTGFTETAGKGLTIGGRQYNATSRFNGYISKVTVYRNQLTDDEAKQLYAIGPQNRILPDDYIQLDYIDGTGTQYIDTGYKPNTNTTIKTKTYVTTNSNAPFACRWSNSPEYDTFGAIVGSTGKLRVYYGRYSDENYTPFLSYDKSIVHDIEINMDDIVYDGISIPITRGSFASTENLYLGAFNNIGEIINTIIGRIYSMKIKESNIMVRDFIPAKRKSDNVLGMYDIVTHTFFTNAGTGTFTAGPAV